MLTIIQSPPCIGALLPLCSIGPDAFFAQKRTKDLGTTE